MSTIPATTGCGSSGPADLSISGPQPGVIYYIDDHLGSSHLVTDSLGNVFREESRYPYGLERSSQTELQSESAVAVDYVYTGKEYDEETGLIYFGGRYYAPELGRWITPDPLFLEKEPKKVVETPKELNLYAYVQGNPVTYRDLNGFRADAGLENGEWYGDFNDMGKSMPRRNATAAELIASDTLALAPVAGPLIVAAGIKSLPAVATFVVKHPDMIVPIIAASLGAGLQALTGEQTGLPPSSGEGKVAFWAAKGIITGIEGYAEWRSDVHEQRWNSMTSKESVSDTSLNVDMYMTSEIGVSLEIESSE